MELATVFLFFSVFRAAAAPVSPLCCEFSGCMRKLKCQVCTAMCAEALPLLDFHGFSLGFPGFTRFSLQPHEATFKLGLMVSGLA